MKHLISIIKIIEVVNLYYYFIYEYTDSKVVSREKYTIIYYNRNIITF